MLGCNPTWFPVILWFIIRNIGLVFIPAPGTELLKTLEFPEEGSKCVFCYLNEWNFGKPTGKNGGCLSEEPTTWPEDWNFPFHPLDHRGGKKGWSLSPITNGQWFNQACLCKEVSIETPKESFQVCESTEVWQKWGLQRAWKLCALSPYLVLCISSIWLFLSYILCIKW